MMKPTKYAWFTALLSVALFAGPLYAADLKAPTKAVQLSAALPTTDPYTGFYIGLNGGYGFNLGNSVNIGQAATVADLAGSPQGFVGGLQAGVGTRFNGFMYAGVEGDFDGANLSGTGSIPGLITATSKNSFLGSVRGRLGVITPSNVLIYGTAGYGFGGGSFSVADVVHGVATTVNPTLSGLAWGGGIEFPLFGSNWLARAEYLQYDFGSFGAATAAQGGSIAFTQKDRVDVIRGGLSYKF